MPLSRRERLRRVTLVCCHFTRNLAYYRVAHPGEPQPESELLGHGRWNFLDQCVLEWCKLLGDEGAQHNWAKIVSDEVRFERELFTQLGMDAAAFQAYRNEMREYAISSSPIWMSSV
jgi:hypothetical protein